MVIIHGRNGRNEYRWITRQQDIIVASDGISPSADGPAHPRVEPARYAKVLGLLRARARTSWT